MQRFEAYAEDVLTQQRGRTFLPALDALRDDQLVALLAGSNARTDEERYRRNVVTTELLNRLAGKAALLDELLPVDAALDGLSVALARALRADVSCFDEVRGHEFVLHGRNNLPAGFREVSRCERTAMALCERVAATGEVLVVPDLTQNAEFCEAPACRLLGLRSYAGAPAFDAEGRVVAVAWVANERPRTYAPDEIALLQRVADRVVAHLRRPRAQ